MLAAAIVAGCSSDYSTATPGGDIVVQLNFGTTSDTASSNGQPFADTIVDENGQPLPGAGFDDAGQVLLVTRATDGTTGEIVINLSNADYSIDRGENTEGGADGSLSLDVNGETLVFTATPGAFFPLLATGGDGTQYTLAPNTSGVFSSTNLISIIGGADDGPFGLYAFGFETNPTQLPAGTANYSGDLAGAVYSDGESAVLEGSITFNANFGTSRISGNATASAFGQNIDFTIDETDIVGNGFTTTATAVCPVPDACESNSQIGGAFFGPDGSEISGIAVIDETITTTEGTSNVVGAAGFTADRTAP